MISPRRRALALMAACLGATLLASEAEATPIYAIRAANACDTCHVEPLGWANPPMPERRCTLDCNGCHVSPTGGGLRTVTGEFYGKQVLPTFGKRPADGADPNEHLPPGYPTKGRYRLGEGFSGWWPGPTPHTDIPDRYGTLRPAPGFQWGLDYRSAGMFPFDDSGRDAAVFPMQMDFHLAARAFEQVIAYASGGLKGSKERTPDSPEGAFDELAAVNELFVKVDGLKDNSYLRAGRFSPPFGWRLPDHTSFIRRGLGFGEKRRVWGLEGGWNPNYPVVQGALFYQGLNDFPGYDVDEGFGAAALGGVRELGWQLLGNAHVLRRTDGVDEATAGVSWGLNLYPLVVLGELDYRSRFGDDGPPPPRADADADDPVALKGTGLFGYLEANLLVARGVTTFAKLDWMRNDVDGLPSGQSLRLTAGGQWDLYTWVQVMPELRATLNDVGPNTYDAVFVAHIWL